MPERIAVRSLRTGGVDYIEVPTQAEAARASLERERDGYVRRGLPDRVAQVDAALAALDPEPVDEPADATEPAEDVEAAAPTPAAASTTTRTHGGRRPHRR